MRCEETETNLNWFTVKLVSSNSRPHCFSLPFSLFVLLRIICDGFDVSWRSIHSTQLHPSIFIPPKTMSGKYSSLKCAWRTHAYTHKLLKYVLMVGRERSHTHANVPIHMSVAVSGSSVNERNGWNYRTPHRAYSDKSDLVELKRERIEEEKKYSNFFHRHIAGVPVKRK